MLHVNVGKPGRTLRGALLGCGHVSLFHLRAWVQIRGVEIVALANRTLSKAETRAREFGIPLEHVYSDYRELLRKEDLDFVDIATVPHIHRQQVEAAAAHGLCVLCQKPFAPTLEDAQAMLAACDQANVLLSINDNWRWRSWYREVKRLLDEGIVGRPRYIRIARHNNMALPRSDGSPHPVFINQAYMAEMDRLILYEWGIHLIDVLRFLFGEVTSVYARMDKVSPLYKGEDRALLTLEVGGVIGLIDISWATVGRGASSSQLERMTLEGDEGTIELLPDQGDILRVTTKREAWQRPAFDVKPEEAYQASYTAAQRDFIECLREGRLPETVASDNLKTLAATMAAYESAAKNQVIHPMSSGSLPLNILKAKSA
jgi:predicted dehydrogenase